MRYECCGGGTTCNDQRPLLPAAGGSGESLSPPAGPGQSPARGPGGEDPESSRDPIVYISQKCQKYTLVGDLN